MAEDLPAVLNDSTARLIGRPITKNDRFGLAISGGADSMAMLGAAARCWPGQIEAATVDHGLRAAAAGEAAMVSDWCESQGIAHRVLRPEVPISGNVQSAARKVRYQLLEDWRVERGLDWLLTAHQADDQIETLVMRLNRGAGVSGLAGVRARRGVLLRPLLGIRRAGLRAYCASERVPFVDDPSNADTRFDRARIRPALANLDLIEPNGLARSTEALAEADEALEWMAGQLAQKHVVADDDRLRLEKTDLPAELLRRILLDMIARTNPESEPPRGPSVDQALVQLLDGKTISLADCVVAGGRFWTVHRAPPRRAG